MEWELLKNEEDFGKLKKGGDIDAPDSFPCWATFIQGNGWGEYYPEYLYEAELTNMLLALHRAQNAKGYGLQLVGALCTLAGNEVI